MLTITTRGLLAWHIVFEDFHLSDPGTASLGDMEGGEISSEPQDSDKVRFYA